VGLLSGGCLEPDLVLRAEQVLADGTARLAVYDLRSPDELVFGLGLGCEGRLDVWLERVDPGTFHPWCDGAPEASGVTPWIDETGVPRELTWRIHPIPRICVHGAGEDARPLCFLFAQALGWDVDVYDRRPGVLEAFDVPGVKRVGGMETLTPEVVASYDALVNMSHHFDTDAHVLALAMAALKLGESVSGPVRLCYVGCLGPARRRERLFVRVPEARVVFPDVVRAPAGLDLGGDAPESIALAIAAEIHAALEGASGRPLANMIRGKEESIHGTTRR
jgi:xanthine dehydrogenase accessory factor